VPGGIAAVVALVGAVLAATGVVGDVLTRWVRNEPRQLTLVLGLALAIAGLATIFAVKSILVRFATAGLVLVLILGVIYATSSIAIREQPHVALAASTSGNGILALTIKAGGASLRPNDDMLVQVIGLKKTGDMHAVMSQCRQSRWSAWSSGQINTDTSDLLVWQQFGPDPAGNVAAEITTQVTRADYGGICAFAVLRWSRGDSPDKARAVAAYLQTTELPSPTATPETTGGIPSGPGKG
jgi:hypothetical protein